MDNNRYYIYIFHLPRYQAYAVCFSMARVTCVVTTQFWWRKKLLSRVRTGAS